MKFSQITCQH